MGTHQLDSDASSGRVAPLLERVEDEVKAVLERGREVVADFGA
jgi:hypothetical protein